MAWPHLVLFFVLWVGTVARRVAAKEPVVNACACAAAALTYLWDR